MLRPLLALTILLSCAPAFATPSQLTAYVRQMPQPELYFRNDQALDARIKMLDYAGAGDRVRIATFEFNEGKAVHLLARHLCMATARGVDAELLADSKSGGLPGLENSFDNDDKKHKVEEIYQYLANCGVRVYIHNQLTDYVDFLGYRMPNFFLDPGMRGKHLSIFDFFKIKRRIDYLLDRTGGILREETARVGVQADPESVLKELKSLVWDGSNFLSVVQRANGYSQDPPQGYDEAVAKLQTDYRHLLNDPLWARLDAIKLREALYRIEDRFKQDPDLGNLWRALRRFNRLNHRKLFLVESGPTGCTILGGRNLGDEYLTEGESNFTDGDVLLCRHHGADASSAITGALAGYEELKNDRSDPILGVNDDVVVSLVAPSRDFKFPQFRGNPEAALGAARVWTDAAPVPGGIPLPEARHWRYLKAGWDPSRDTVKNEIVRRIRAEKREVYLETAYAEFDFELRDAIENALARGVYVRLVTNSFFITDGPSKLIRITMSRWMENMMALHPSLFEVRYVTVAGKHMTHFKGAAFGCQLGGDRPVRSFLLGSHNFDPRSGRSDKDHAFTWEEASGACTDLASSAFVSGRFSVYVDLAVRSNASTLAQYPHLLEELETVGAHHEVKSETDRLTAVAMRNIFYTTNNGVAQLNYKDQITRLLELMDDGGLHDLLGRVL